LSGKERACPCCGVERQEIGAEESWQIECLPGHFERIQHVRKKYAGGPCEASAEGPQIAVAARAESPLGRGLAGPGLLAYFVTSKFSDYLPLNLYGRKWLPAIGAVTFLSILQLREGTAARLKVTGSMPILKMRCRGRSSILLIKRASSGTKKTSLQTSKVRPYPIDPDYSKFN
jgi:hypothetical protein